jgi:imidazole glycerol-phosphate synthase subunit HisH
MIKIIDYKIGNINSISNVLKKIKVKNEIITNVKEIKKNDKVILPGVGSYDDCIFKLKDYNFFDFLKYEVKNLNLKVLGICLGMQILCNSSEEGTKEGLGFFPYNCEAFKSQNKFNTVVGWSKTFPYNYDINKNVLNLDERYYFLHSYYVPFNSDTISYAQNFDTKYSAIIKKNNIIGCQFHPERSHIYGMEFLRKFSNF